MRRARVRVVRAAGGHPVDVVVDGAKDVLHANVLFSRELRHLSKFEAVKVVTL
jgi:hypothetical protein